MFPDIFPDESDLLIIETFIFEVQRSGNFPYSSCRAMTIVSAPLELLKDLARLGLHYCPVSVVFAPTTFTLAIAAPLFNLFELTDHRSYLSDGVLITDKRHIESIEALVQKIYDRPQPLAINVSNSNP